MIRDLELIKKIFVEFDTFPDHRLFTPETGDPLSNRNLFALRGKLILRSITLGFNYISKT